MNAKSMHPYKNAPDRAFWSRSVSRQFKPQDMLDVNSYLIRRGDNVVSAGSCFASNMVPYLRGGGFTYLQTETMHPAFAGFATDNFGYSNFSACYGNIYTVRQLLQLLRRALGQFEPVESYWRDNDQIVDPFRPGLRYPARTLVEFEALTKQHLARTKQAFHDASVFVLTLGLTEAWVSRHDGAVFPACPGTVAGEFDPACHFFYNFTVNEIIEDLGTFISELRKMNPSCRFIVTVSPVPLVATATGGHVLCASIYSKSVLRVVAQEVAAQHPEVTYFPAYEIVTGPQAPDRFFELDRRNVTAEAVETVMAALLDHCEPLSAAGTTTPQLPAEMSVSNLSEVLDAECEEVMSER